MRILLVDDTGKDLELLRDALVDAGHTIVGECDDALSLLALVGEAQPDVIIIDTDSPTRDVLEQLFVVSRENPRPIVMFTDDGDAATIRAALDAGVTTYIVEGLQPHRVRPILEVAKARFDADRALRAELDEARSELVARKRIERAKGLLMKARGLSEDDAYRALRKLAMDQPDHAGRRRAAVDRRGRAARLNVRSAISVRARVRAHMRGAKRLATTRIATQSPRAANPESHQRVGSVATALASALLTSSGADQWRSASLRDQHDAQREFIGNGADRSPSVRGRRDRSALFIWSGETMSDETMIDSRRRAHGPAHRRVPRWRRRSAPASRNAAWAAGSDAPEKPEVKIGFIPLTDCASVVMASVKGFDAKHGVKIVPTKEASWAAVRDKLVNGELDAAHVLYGLVYGVQLGLGGPKKDMSVLMTLNQNGQAITLSNQLREKGVTDGASLAKLVAKEKREYTFAQTFPTGTHAMWLYYWLAAHGINPMADVKTITVPPPQMVANMRVGNMDGYCVGEPWGARAIADKIGFTAVTTQDIWVGPSGEGARHDVRVGREAPEHRARDHRRDSRGRALDRRIARESRGDREGDRRQGLREHVGGRDHRPHARRLRQRHRQGVEGPERDEVLRRRRRLLSRTSPTACGSSRSTGAGAC